MNDSEFLKHAARAFFASAWADQCDEAGQSSILSGKEIMCLIPAAIDPAAEHAARTLCFDLQRANAGASLADLFARCQSAQVFGEPLTLELFAHYCAMQAMGHGVGLFDYGIRADVCAVPYIEFGAYSLERDYF